MSLGFLKQKLMILLDLELTEIKKIFYKIFKKMLFCQQKNQECKIKKLIVLQAQVNTKEIFKL